MVHGIGRQLRKLSTVRHERGSDAHNERVSSRSSGRLPRFLTLADVADVLAVDLDVARELVESNQLAAIRIGEAGQWRVEQDVLEAFIEDQYELRRREALFAQQEFIDLPEFTARD